MIFCSDKLLFIHIRFILRYNIPVGNNKVMYMKKTILILTAMLLMSASSYAAQSGAHQAAETTQSILGQMRDAIVRDVHNSVDQSVNAGVNSLKLASYKAQLAQKKRELARIEASDYNYFLKNYKKFKIRQEIRDLENKIADLERQLHY